MINQLDNAPLASQVSFSPTELAAFQHLLFPIPTAKHGTEPFAFNVPSELISLEMEPVKSPILFADPST